jgi:hypothetical protein
MLIEHWPCALAFDELVEGALQRAAPYLGAAPPAGTRVAMIEDLFGGVMHGLLGLHTVAPRCTNRPSDTPLAHPVAAFQAERGPLVVDAHHGMHELDDLSVDVLKLSNGRRSRDEMVEALAARLEAGRTTLDVIIAALARRGLYTA